MGVEGIAVEAGTEALACAEVLVSNTEFAVEFIVVALAFAVRFIAVKLVIALAFAVGVVVEFVFEFVGKNASS